MAGLISDFSRRPPRERAAIYAGIVALLGLLYWQFGLSPVRKGVTNAEAELDGARSEARRLTTEKRKRDELFAKQQDLKEQIEKNQRALPTDAEMPAFFDMLARRFIEAGVTVKRRDVRPEVTVESFVKAPVEVEISGSYYQIMQFFSSLRPHLDADGNESAGKDRIVTVENLSLFEPKVINNQLLLTAKFTASTFRAAAPPPPPPGTPAPAAATPPAGSPATGPATTKLPSPADAKKAAADANAATIQRATVTGGEGEEAPVGTQKGSATGADRLKGGL